MSIAYYTHSITISGGPAILHVLHVRYIEAQPQHGCGTSADVPDCEAELQARTTHPNAATQARSSTRFAAALPAMLPIWQAFESAR
jgi:hypothetical protein